MAVIGIALYAIGGVIALVGYIWLVVVAFRVGGAGWGIGSLLIGIIGLIFAITHWEAAKRPFLVEVAGAVLIGIGAVLVGIGAAGTTTSTSFLF